MSRKVPASRRPSLSTSTRPGCSTTNSSFGKPGAPVDVDRVVEARRSASGRRRPGLPALRRLGLARPSRRPGRPSASRRRSGARRWEAAHAASYPAPAVLFAGLGALALLAFSTTSPSSVTSVSGGTAEISVTKEPPAATPPFVCALTLAAEAGVDPVEHGEVAGFDRAQLPDRFVVLPGLQRPEGEGLAVRGRGPAGIRRSRRGAGSSRPGPRPAGRAGRARPVGR